MKLRILSLLLVAFVTSPFLLRGANTAGPNGGRLLPAQPLQAEFLVDASRKIHITFFDASLRPAEAGEALVELVAETPDGRQSVDLEAAPHGFTSTGALPGGDPYRVVVRIREKPGARAQNFRIDLDLHLCGGCDRAEYACTCADH